MRRRYRAVVVGALVGLLGVLGTAPLQAGAQASPSGWGEAEENEFVRLINDLRISKGLSALRVDIELVQQARIWSQTMNGNGSIFHSSDLGGGISANWRKLGENVGVGGTVQALFDAFVASPSHYQNLVDPDYEAIGIGVIWDGTRMFTAHRFMAVFPPKAPAPALPASAIPTSQPFPSAPPLSSPEPGGPNPAPAGPSSAPTAPEPEPVRGDAADRLSLSRIDAVLRVLATFGE